MRPVPPSRRRVARSRAKNYWQVATHLMESARALIALGEEVVLDEGCRSFHTINAGSEVPLALANP